jgi:hypothetical protein
VLPPVWRARRSDYVSITLFGAVLNAASRDLEVPGGEEIARAMADATAHHATFAVACKRLLQAVVFNTPSLY